MPQSRVALLAAIASAALRGVADDPAATIAVWRVRDADLGVDAIRPAARAVVAEVHNGWQISVDEGLLQRLRRQRAERLPNETGGVLMGSFDAQRRIVHVVDMVPSPPDSEEWPTLYIRGAEGLADRVRQIQASTLHRLRYVGEWHSHPDRVRVRPERGRQEGTRLALGEYGRRRFARDHGDRRRDRASLLRTAYGWRWGRLVIDKFDLYEIIGVVAPGSVLLFGGILLFPAIRATFGLEGIDLGGFGIFLILSFVAGHLVQAFGNLIELIIWRPFGGMPTSWVLRPDQHLLDETQLERLRRACAREFDVELDRLDQRRWAALIREIYAIVRKEGAADRIDAFNRTYGFMRGVGTALLVLALATVVQYPEAWGWAIASVLAAGLAFYRLIRFGQRYGRELFVEFIRVAPDIVRQSR